MSGPKSGQGGDAFDDFFGDPSPSGRMSPASEETGATPFSGEPDDEPTQDVELRRRTTQATQASVPVPAITPEPTPHGAVPESWWQSDAEAPAPAAAPHSSTWHAQPGPQINQPQTAHPQGPRRGLSPLAMVGMLVGGVLIGGICAGATVMALNQDDEPVAQSTTVTETSSPTSTSPSTSSTTTTSSTSTSSSSSTTSPARKGKLPSGAKECAGPKQGTAVGSGNDVTSCAFASAVRDAYLAEKPKDGKASLEVRSPVTKKNYTMTCTGASVTTCTGGNNAVVFLY